MGKKKGRRNNGGGGIKTHKNKLKSFGSVNGAGHDNHQMDLQLAKFSSQRNAPEADDYEGYYVCGNIQELLTEAMLDGGELDEESYQYRPYSFDTSGDDDDDDDDGEFWFRSQSPIFANNCRNRKREINKAGRFDDNLDARVAFRVLIEMLLAHWLLEEETDRKKRFIWKSIIISFLVIAFVMWYWWY